MIMNVTVIGVKECVYAPNLKRIDKNVGYLDALLSCLQIPLSLPLIIWAGRAVL